MRISPERLDRKMIAQSKQQTVVKIEAAKLLFGESKEGKSLARAFQRMV
jgi:hypothetical protein